MKPKKGTKQAIRFNFSYDENNLTLKSKKIVNMTCPASASLKEIGKMSGFWYELQDNNGSVVYRRFLHDPIQLDIEIFPAGPKKPFSHKEKKKISGQFSFSVPKVSTAKNLVIFSSPWKIEKRYEAAAELAKFDLESDSKKENN